MKSFYDEAIELFGEQRELTEEEQKALAEGLYKIWAYYFNSGIETFKGGISKN